MIVVVPEFPGEPRSPAPPPPPPLQRLLFEAAEGQTDRLARLLDKCQQVGVSLSE